MKVEKNEVIEKDLEEMKKQAETAESNNELDKASDIAYRMAQMKKELDTPTLFERICAFFDKPMVRFGLMIAFAILASVIARWLLRKSKDEDLEPEEDQQAGYQQQPPHYGYPQYGYHPQPPPPFYGYHQKPNGYK